MREKYLPIGTICKLKDGKKNIMIIGFCQSSQERENEIYDYSGCMYPEGVFSSEISFLFNHNQIEEILYEGYVNEEEKQFKARLNELITNGTIDGKKVDFDLNENKVPNFKQEDNAEKHLFNNSQEQINEQSVLLNQYNNSISTSSNFNTLNLNDLNNNQQ